MSGISRNSQADELRITTVQFDMRGSTPAENLLFIENILRDQKNRQDLIVLPEVFTTGCIANAREFASAPNGEIYEWLRFQAAHYNSDICGSVIIKHEDNYYNRLLWATTDGTIHEYDKRHLFRMLGEHLRYKSGEEQLLVSLKGWRIAPFICYDLRFPVWMRNCENYDLAVVVANWPMQRREHWQALLRARAIENLCFTLGCNRIGLDGFNNQYSGDSQLYNANGDLLMNLGNHDYVSTTSINLADLKKYRENFPAFLDRDSFHINAQFNDTLGTNLHKTG